MTRHVYTAIAKRWSGGWELHIDGVGVTQSHSLEKAEYMVRDYIAMDLDVPKDSFEVRIVPELGGQKLSYAAAKDLKGLEKQRLRHGRGKSKILGVFQGSHTHTRH